MKYLSSFLLLLIGIGTFFSCNVAFSFLPIQRFLFHQRNQLSYRLQSSNEPKFNVKIFDNFYDPKPNAPIVKEMNKDKGYVDLRVYINDMATLQAHKDLIGICMKVSKASLPSFSFCLYFF